MPTIAEDIAIITAQETALVFDQFDEHTAFALGSWIRAEAVARDQGIVAEVRLHDRQLFFASTPGATADNTDWVNGKSRLTLRLHKSSYRIGLEFKREGRALEDRLLNSVEYRAHGGCFPIRVKGAGVIGAVTVSGLPQREDHNLAVAGVSAILGLEIPRLG